ncbi:MAG: hypothetical protein BAA00_12470 [Parageobacillus thermoglucosidasius]|nr:MAG: hypothetical protein BAA00_12470 [Parageobacillus thermoglucosidasius]
MRLIQIPSFLYDLVKKNTNFMVIWQPMQRHSPFFPEYPGFQHGARLFTAQTASAILAPQNDIGHICAEIEDRRQKQHDTGRRQRPAIFANGQTLPRNPPAGWHDGAMTLWAKTTVLLSHVPGSCAFCPAKSFTKNPRYQPWPVRCQQQETGTVPRFPQSLAASRNPWRRAFAAVSAAARQPFVRTVYALRWTF